MTPPTPPGETRPRNEAAEMTFTAKTRYRSLSEHLLLRSRREGECLRWQGTHTARGYGCMSYGGHTQLVHRLAHLEWVGPIPEGKELDHLCRVPDCLEPSHLEPVTSRQNTLRGKGPTAVNAAKTHCPRGHAYTPENTYSYRGHRYCRTCGGYRLLDGEER